MEVLAILAAIFGLPAVVLHNKIVKKRHRVEHLQGTVRMLAQRRLDIVPELTSVVREHMPAHADLIAEVETVERLMREKPAASQDVIREIGKAADMAARTIAGHAELKNKDQVIHLQRIIFEVEERVMAAVRAYNAAVSDFNNTISGFPASSVATTMGIEPYEYLTHVDHEFLARGDSVL